MAAQVDDSAVQNYNAIQAQALTAMANLRAYNNLASPTNAQNIALLKLHNNVLLGLIRLQFGQLDGTN